MNRIISALLIVVLLCGTGCESPRPIPWDSVTMATYRRPFEMLPPVQNPPPTATPITSIATADSQGEKPNVPLFRPLPVSPPIALDPEKPKPAPTEMIETARSEAVQHPTPEGFINAVQIYRFDPGAVYEVMTAPGFVTMLHLRPGEELKHLAAGDTSRWLIDIVESGNAESNVGGVWPRDTQPEVGRVSVLIKPRFPMLRTNLLIATNEREYLIDLKSLEGSTYHSAVEWTYPRLPTVFPSPAKTPRSVTAAPEGGARHYVYSLQAPSGGFPPWAPEAVYDDGHRVYVQFPAGINDVRRPPLFLLDRDGIARMVNYRTESNRYVVDELFDRAVLRMGDTRVIIERTLPRPDVAQ